MSTRTIKLIVEYDGTDFAGWQLQPGERTIQRELEAALEKLVKRPVRITGSGRTDSGVHAAGQVVSFHIEEDIPTRAFREGLNSLLPADLKVKEASEAPEGFDARRSARGKRYRYRVLNRETPSPLVSRYTWWQRRPWDLESLQAATPALLGTHDFTSFRAADCQAKNPIRIMRSIDVRKVEEEIWLTFEATAFLKQMVRNLVGTLAEVALHKRTPASVAEVLAAKDRGKAGPTAPPQGLTLLYVFYEDPTAPQ